MVASLARAEEPAKMYKEVWNALSHKSMKAQCCRVSPVSRETVNALRGSIPEKYLWIHLEITYRPGGITIMVHTPDANTSWTGKKTSAVKDLPPFQVLPLPQGAISEKFSDFERLANKFVNELESGKLGDPIEEVRP